MCDGWQSHHHLPTKAYLNELHKARETSRIARLGGESLASSMKERDGGGIAVRAHDSCAEGLRVEPDSRP